MSTFGCCFWWLLLGVAAGWLLWWLFDRYFRRDGPAAGERAAAEATRLETELAATRRARLEAENAMREQGAALAQAQKRIAAQQADLDWTRRTLAEGTATAASLRAALTESRGTARSAAGERSEAQRLASLRESEVSRLSETLFEVRGRLRETESRLTESEQTGEVLRRNLAAARHDLGTRAAAMTTLQRRIEALSAQLAACEAARAAGANPGHEGQASAGEASAVETSAVGGRADNGGAGNAEKDSGNLAVTDTVSHPDTGDGASTGAAALAAGAMDAPVEADAVLEPAPNTTRHAMAETGHGDTHPESRGPAFLAAAAAAGFRPRREGKDDLTVVEGVGPKIAALLVANGIDTFEKLAASSVHDLTSLLEAAGPNFRLANPGTWPEQAGLCARGDWSALRARQDALDGGIERPPRAS
ncbi:MAG: DUF4332 domain-containing protein [Burkholderiaceae bacterium]|nr:DUF4332 domain-containing protein [Burkholderiaceae bacterium]